MPLKPRNKKKPQNSSLALFVIMLLLVLGLKVEVEEKIKTFPWSCLVGKVNKNYENTKENLRRNIFPSYFVTICEQKNLKGER